MTRVSHNTSVSGLVVAVVGGGGLVGGWGGEKLAYGQSQRVTFGLEFTLGSDAHAGMNWRGLWRRSGGGGGVFEGEI